MKPLKTLGLSLAIGAALTLPAMAQHNPYGTSYGRGGQPAAILYANPDFTGRSIRVDRPIPRLADYRFNDRASSIVVTGGAWEVCVDANYRGRCEVVAYREGRLNQVRLNDKITSIRPVAYGPRTRYNDGPRHGRRDGYDRRDRYDRNGNTGGHYGGRRGHTAPVVLFQHPNFRGQSLPLNGAVAHLNQLRFNDKVSSIAIQNGAWEVCTDPNFRGRCEIIDASAAELGYYRLNDNITSIRPAGRGYGYDRRNRRHW